MSSIILPVMLDMTIKLGTKPTIYSGVNCRKLAVVERYIYFKYCLLPFAGEL